MSESIFKVKLAMSYNIDQEGVRLVDCKLLENAVWVREPHTGPIGPGYTVFLLFREKETSATSSGARVFFKVKGSEGIVNITVFGQLGYCSAEFQCEGDLNAEIERSLERGIVELHISKQR